MYCHNCGREIGNARFCPICGAEQPDIEAEGNENVSGTPVYTVPDYGQQPAGAYDTSGSGTYNSNPVAEKYRAVFTDPTFLAITVIITVTTILSILTGSRSVVFLNSQVNVSGIRITVSVIPILFTIALWIIFASVRGRGEIKTTGFAMASGTLKAIRIIMWICIIVFIIAAVFVIVAGSRLMSEVGVSLPEFFDELSEELSRSGINIPYIGNAEWIARIGAALIAIVLILAIVLFVVFIVCYKKIHKFAKSVCVSLKTGTENFRSVRGAKNWLIFLAVISFISAVINITSIRYFNSYIVLSMILNLLNGIAALLASSMIKNNFLNNSEY